MGQPNKSQRATAAPHYTSRLQKGGALLDEMRTLVRAWTPSDPAQQRDQAVRSNLLHRATRARAQDVLARAFFPRFVNGPVPNAWELARAIEVANAPIALLRPVYYWITAAAEPLMADFVLEYLAGSVHPDEIVSTAAAVRWFRRKGLDWSEVVAMKTARAMLAGLRDFGILQGSAHKRLAGLRLSVPAFSYIAFCLVRLGAGGHQLVVHRDWQLFLLSHQEVEQYLLRAHQDHLLEYHAAGAVVVLSFPTPDLEAYARVVATAAR